MKRYLFILIFLCTVLCLPQATQAASLSINPATGIFSVGSTFDISVLLDTNGKSVNALSVSLQFPPDMLQVVSPSTGQSIIGVWTAAPKYDNQLGRIDLQGGIPGGITASGGLVTTLTFRVKAVGEAIVKFLDGSKILLNDGLGTNALNQTGNAVYQFKLPAPAGPTLVSDTNPDQATWYSNRTVSFRFASDTKVSGYSYVLSDDPTTIPDDINEGAKNYITYSDLPDGTHYFHIKSLRDGVWGGTTHYSVKIDATPPADFKINIAPSSQTSSRQPIVQFATTDALSGVDHYELKIIPLTFGTNQKIPDKGDTFFIEEVSPYVPPLLELGTYDVIIRAYDKSHNYREVTERLNITTALFSFVSNDGIILGGQTLSWIWVFFTGLIILIIIIFVFYQTRRWHSKIHNAHQEKKLPKDIASQLEELKRYRAKYGSKVLGIVLLFLTFTLGHRTLAQDTVFAPPIINSISSNISNQDTFYVGGKANYANEKIIIYLQNITTGETYNESVNADTNGEWFYRHSSVLSPGNYLIWIQGKLDENLSPPSAQEKIKVTRTAIKFSNIQISYETIYLAVCVLLLLGILVLGIFTLIVVRRGRQKRKEFKREIREAEESIKRGFAVLRRDIEAELVLVKRAKLSGDISEEEKAREKELLDDLNKVQKQIGREIWELESAG